MSRTARLGTLSLLLLAACAPAVRPGAPRPALHGEADVAAAAALLRVEDRRELDLAVVEGAAASANPELRRRAALTAGRVGDPRALPLLLRLLQDPDTAVVATTAFALGHLGDTTAISALAPLLSAERAAAAPTVAGEAATALGKLRTDAARAAVAGFLRGSALEGAAAREAVGRALLASWRFRRDPDLAPITRWAGSADPELRWRAVYSLARRPDPAATPALLRAAADPDWRVRSSALRGLTAALADSSGVGAATAREAALAALADAHPLVRVGAARALATHAHPSAVEALAALLRSGDPHLEVVAAESLGRLGARAASAAPALRAEALDSSRVIGVRTAALQALAEVSTAEAAEAAARFAAEPGWRSRAAAARIYARVGPVPRPELEALARDADPRVAAAALNAAFTAPGARLAALRPVLLESLAAADPGVRNKALVGLARLADTTTVGAVLDAYARGEADPVNDATLGAIGALESLRRAGASTVEPFFARFRRSPDYLVRQSAVDHFGDAATRAWGPVLPVETGVDEAGYRALVREWVVPGLAGRLPRVRIVTESGAIDLELFAADAPLTVRNLMRLAERGYFDGQDWPRVVPGFMVQGGDPRGDTTGGPGYAIRDEINRHPYLGGTLGMALSGADSGGSQFFITHSPQPHLDGAYTVFGRVLKGMDTVDRVQVGEKILRVVPLR